MQKYGVNLICVDESIDSSKDSGRLMITVLSAVAEIERENILVQTMEGFWLGLPLVSFRNISVNIEGVIKRG